MITTMRNIIIAGLFLTTGCGDTSSSLPIEFKLDNGLEVILRPVREATLTSLVVLYAIGEDHDPRGSSGMGHLIEHLYVTAASGETPAREGKEKASAAVVDGANMG